MTSPSRRLLSAAVIGTLALAGALAAAAPASAAPRVSISVSDRPGLGAVADTTYLTELTLSGAGFQSVQNGFGGIYVLFGTVAGGAWSPSAGGSAGSEYRYVYDDESNPVGYQLFVTFPGSSTSYAANGGMLAADGTWNATIRVPGPVFQAYDRAGGVTTVDCLVDQCGIITIGAHGVHNAANESFTPIAFREIYGASEGRQVIAPGEPVVNAVAPTVIGGRPATIPAAVPDAQLTAETSRGASATVGRTRLTLTVPAANPQGWVGVYLHSEPLFTGWYKPNSTGELDIDLPGNLEPGQHRAVAVGSEGDVLGWAEFEFAAEPAAETTAVPEAAPLRQEPSASPTLVIVAIAVGAVALAAVAVLVWVLRRRTVPALEADPTRSTE